MSPRSQARLELNRRLSREAKRRRRGTCEICGAETRYGGKGPPGVSPLCGPCGRRKSGETRRGNGPIQQQLRELIAGGVDRYGDLRDRLGISSQHASVALNREVKAGRVRRVSRGRYELPNEESA